MKKGCPKCGRMIDEKFQTCPYCKFNFEELEKFYRRVKKQKFVEEGKYAGIIKRTVAGLIDIEIILIICESIIILLNNARLVDYRNYVIHITLFCIMYILINSILERTEWHGSLGKKITKIEVLDRYENPLTFTSSLIRNISKIVNVISAGIGYLICSIEKNKRTLGDILTNTHVINNNGIKDEKDEKEYAYPSKRLFAFTVDIVIISAIICALLLVPTLLKVTKVDLPEMFKGIIHPALIIISFVVALFYFPLAESTSGKTFGKKLVHIKLIGTDKEIINFPKAFIRQFLILIDILTLGFMLSMTNKQRQTLKDILMKTVVIDA